MMSNRMFYCDFLRAFVGGDDRKRKTTSNPNYQGVFLYMSQKCNKLLVIIDEVC